MSESSTIRWDKGDDGVVILTLDDPNASANTMNEAYQESIRATVDRLEAERDELTGVIVTSAKKTFFVGANLNDLKLVTKDDTARMTEFVREAKAVLRRLETLGKPIVAAVNGTALGGGLEIALACHHRIVVDDATIKLGFPEVKLGLLPGAGGVTRSVRMFGIAAALVPLLLQGKEYRPAEALEFGLVDEVVGSRDDLIGAAKAWIAANPESVQPWDVKGYKIPGGTPATPKFAANLPAFPANLRKQIKGANLPAPHHIMAAAVEGSQVDFDNASEIEGRYFVDLVTGQVAKNMIQAFFFDLQRATGSRGRPDDSETFQPAKMVVLGAGMMGAAIAYVAAKSGVEVVLKDVSQDAADRGKGYSEKLVAKAVERGRSSQQDGDALLARITPTTDPAAADGAELVIEAVFEDPSVKREVMAEIEPHLAPHALLGSNTSTLPITGLAENVSRPADFIGLHFFSPVDKMPLLEIIKGRADVRRDPVPGAGRRQAAEEDADRRQRQPRLLHQPRDRNVHQRGDRHAGRGDSCGDDRTGVLTGGLSSAGTAAVRRAEHEADAEDPHRRPRGDRGRWRHLDVQSGGGRDRHDGRHARPAGPARRRRLLRVRRWEAHGPVEGLARAVADRRQTPRRSRCETSRSG